MGQDANIACPPKCILIVDDEEVICEMLALILENNGFTTLRAFDTQQALEIAETHRIDLMISDLHLPKGSGIELIKRLKTIDGSKIKTIFMSGSTSEIRLENVQAFGGVAVMEKPINFEALLNEIRRALNM